MFMLELLRSSGYLNLFLPACTTQNSQDLEKSAGSRDPKADEARRGREDYRPISLVCVSYKILERLIYGRVEPIIDLLLPREQAGF